MRIVRTLTIKIFSFQILELWTCKLALHGGEVAFVPNLRALDLQLREPYQPRCPHTS